MNEARSRKPAESGFDRVGAQAGLHEAAAVEQARAGRVGQSLEARAMGVGALSDLLTAKSSHDASCPHCAGAATEKTSAAKAEGESEAGREAKAGIANGHGGGCNCANCVVAAPAGVESPVVEAHAGDQKAETFEAAAGDEAHCPGLDLGELDQKMSEAARKAVQGAGGAGGAGNQQQQALGPNQGQQQQQNPAAGGAQGGAGGGGAHASVEAAGSLSALDAGVMVAEAGMGASEFQASSGFMATLVSSLSQPGMQAHAGTEGWGLPSGFPGTLGLTTMTNSFVAPALNFDISSTRTGGELPEGGAPEGGPDGGAPVITFVAKLRRTTSTDATHPCVAAPAGEHVTGTEVVTPPGGAAITFNKVLKIEPAYAQKIWDAEAEHLNDGLEAYRISLKKAENEVNALAGREFTGPSEDMARSAATDELAKHLDPKLTVDPATWRTMVWSLTLLTISGRDNKRWHTFFTTAPVVDMAAKKITTTLTDGDTQINSHPSSEVVNYSHV